MERIFFAALEREAGQRGQFLAEACCGDDQLCRELESLLARNPDACGPLDRPIWECLETLATNPTHRPLEQGTKLGSYTLGPQIGAGGMGIVYRAEDTKLRRLVAIKSMAEGMPWKKEAVERLWREARAASALNHPNINAIYSIEEFEERPFIVMELLEGKSLKEVIDGRPLDIETLLEFAVQIAEGLVAAHSKAIIHRDIKPANLFVSTQKQIKILDFGIAKFQDADSTKSLVQAAANAKSDDATLTTGGALIGTIAYMSPEQVGGLELDTRTDLFSFGAVLYEMATGVAPFRGDTRASIGYSILNRTPTSPRELNPKVSRGLENVIDKALQKDRERRYQSASEIQSDLNRLLTKATNRKRRMFRVPAALAGGVLALLIFWFWHQRPQIPMQPIEKQLTANPPEDWITGAAISPDGKTVAYHDQTGLYIRTVDTSETRPVTVPASIRDRIIDLKWFPDGSRLLVPIFTGTSEWDADGWVISISGRPPAQLFRRNVTQGSISRDGRSIVFLGKGGLYAAEIDGGGMQRTLRAGASGEWIFSPVWSPDGRWIAYAHLRASSRGMLSSIEVQSATGGPIRTLLSDSVLPTSSNICYMGVVGSCLSWSDDWRLVFSVSKSSAPAAADAEFGIWQLRLQPGAAAAIAKPERLAHWTDYAPLSPSLSPDGKRLWFLKAKRWEDVYVAELAADGTLKTTPRRFTLDDRGNYTNAWTPEGDAILFGSDRVAPRAIFKQAVGESSAQTLAQSTDFNYDNAAFSPDRLWVLFQASNSASANSPTSRVRLLRKSATGGRPATVFEEPASTQWSFACPQRTASSCVLAEADADDLNFYSLDPVRGKGAKIARAFRTGSIGHTGPSEWSVSPDGSEMAYLINEGRIEILRVQDGTKREISIGGVWRNPQTLAWAADGKSLFVTFWRPDSSDLVRVTLSGAVTPVIQNGHNQWQWITDPLPSPDGKYLAFQGMTWDSNIWTLENFDTSASGFRQ